MCAAGRAAEAHFIHRYDRGAAIAFHGGQPGGIRDLETIHCGIEGLLYDIRAGRFKPSREELLGVDPSSTGLQADLFDAVRLKAYGVVTENAEWIEVIAGFLVRNGNITAEEARKLRVPR